MLVMHYVGIGKVVALPAGLGKWANAWIDWKEWGEFVKGLIDWSAVNNQNKSLDVKSRLDTDGIILEVDSLTSTPDWKGSQAGQVVLNDPSGQIHNQALRMIAPGRYSENLAIGRKGLYRLTIRIGELSTSLNLFNNAIEEYIPSTGASEFGLSAFDRESSAKLEL